MTIRREPSQAVGGARARPVFAADPAAITQGIDEIEQVRIVHFARIRLVPVRHARNLDMADTRVAPFHVAAEFDGEIAFHDLAVVTIELDLQVRRADLFADSLRLILPVQEEAGYIARIDRFDPDVDA